MNLYLDKQDIAFSLILDPRYTSGDSEVNSVYDRI